MLPFLSHLPRLLRPTTSKITQGFSWLNENLWAEEERWVLWAPVALGTGCLLYFSLKEEPSGKYYIFWGIVLLFFSFLGLVYQKFFFTYRKKRAQFLAQSTPLPPIVRFLSWAMWWIFFGFGLAFFRTTSVNPHPLRQGIGPLWVQGVIQEVDHPASKNRLFQRITLILQKKKEKAFPHPEQAQKKPSAPLGARITLRTASQPLYEGDMVRLKVKLQPLPGPLYEGAYDLAFTQFYQGVGAYGFALTSPEVIHAFQPTHWYGKLLHFRHTLTRKLHQQLKPPLGALACGLTTGDKVALTPDARAWFADSGLAHILAIAGLHVSILSGLCFMVMKWILGRLALLSPGLALRLHTERWASLFSLFAAWVYLTLSGGRCPSQRAFFMLSATCIALIISRRRHAMRILMACAFIFLLMAPEAVAQVSYQLSFAAVLGLLAFYEYARKKNFINPRKNNPRVYLPKTQRFFGMGSIWPLFLKIGNRWREKSKTSKSFIHPLLSWIHSSTLFSKEKRKSLENFFKKIKKQGKRSVQSSLTASAAITVMTLPITAYHFHHISLQGFIANVIAVPYTAAILIPLGFFSLSSLMMDAPWSNGLMNIWGTSLEGLLWIARFSSENLKTLLWPVPHFPGWSLFLQMLGLIWLALWQRSWRYWGIGFFSLAWIGGMTCRQIPQALFDGPHGLWAWIDQDKKILYVSSRKKGKLSAQRWQQAFCLKTIQPLSIKDQMMFYKKIEHLMLLKNPSAQPPIVFHEEKGLIFPDSDACLWLDQKGNLHHGGRRPWYAPEKDFQENKGG